MQVIALFDITQTIGSLSILRPRHTVFEMDEKEAKEAIKAGLVSQISPTRTSAKNRETK